MVILNFLDMPKMRLYSSSNDDRVNVAQAKYAACTARNVCFNQQCQWSSYRRYEEYLLEGDHYGIRQLVFVVSKSKP